MTPLNMRGYREGVPLESLPPIAMRTIEAAIRILERDGFPGLTYEAIGAESGEYKDSIRYYFGGKDGLIEAVFDALWHDSSLEVYAGARQHALGEARIRSTVYSSRSIVRAPAYAVMWEILPHVLRDETMRRRVAQLYESYRGHNLEVFGALDLPGAAECVRDYASLMLAMLDGLAIQRALDPDAIDLDRLFGLWADIMAGPASTCMDGGVAEETKRT